jgi:hypothetical protein
MGVADGAQAVRIMLTTKINVMKENKLFGFILSPGNERVDGDAD